MFLRLVQNGHNIWAVWAVLCFMTICTYVCLNTWHCKRRKKLPWNVTVHVAVSCVSTSILVLKSYHLFRLLAQTMGQCKISLILLFSQPYETHLITALLYAKVQQWAQYHGQIWAVIDALSQFVRNELPQYMAKFKRRKKLSLKRYSTCKLSHPVSIEHPCSQQLSPFATFGTDNVTFVT